MDCHCACRQHPGNYNLFFPVDFQLTIHLTVDNLQDKVDLWEAIVTFLFFPILVVIAFFADKGHFNKLFCQVYLSVCSQSTQQVT